MKNYALTEKRSFFLDSVYFKTGEGLPDFKNLILNIEDIFPKVSLINEFVFVKAGYLTLPDGKKLFIKKYEKRDFFYRLEFLVKRTRAEKTWYASLALENNNIFHPKVYAALARRKNGLFEGAYIITEWVENIFSPDTSSALFEDLAKREIFCHRVVELLCSVHKAQIFHSDTKLYNFFITAELGGKEKLGIWDLDGAVVYDKLPMAKRYKDLARLTASFIECYTKKGAPVDRQSFTREVLLLYRNSTDIDLRYDLLSKIINNHLRRKGLF